MLPRFPVISLLAAFVAPAHATTQAPSRPFVLADSEVSTIASEAVGDVFEIHVAGTAGSLRRPGRPVLFVLDSNEDFPLVTALARRLVDSGDLPDLLIVGVGYPESALYLRSRDYTLTQGGPPDRPSGGGRAFLRFMRTELVPWVESTYGPTHSRVLVGHSLGGLLGLSALVEEPDLFDGIVASSPAAWWNSEEIVRSIAESSARGFPPIYTSIGGEETELMSRAWDNLAATLRARSPLGALRTEVFEGEDHGSVKAFAFSRGLRWVFGNVERQR